MSNNKAQGTMSAVVAAMQSAGFKVTPADVFSYGPAEDIDYEAIVGRIRALMCKLSDLT